VLADLEELDIWLSGHVQHGMASSVEQLAQACRTIAQRLVDPKPPGLRDGSIPFRRGSSPCRDSRPHAAIRELGQVHLISQAYRRARSFPNCWRRIQGRQRAGRSHERRCSAIPTVCASTQNGGSSPCSPRHNPTVFAASTPGYGGRAEERECLSAGCSLTSCQSPPARQWRVLRWGPY
jgi:hypothetical protein